MGEKVAGMVSPISSQNLERRFSRQAVQVVPGSPILCVVLQEQYSAGK